MNEKNLRKMKLSCKKDIFMLGTTDVCKLILFASGGKKKIYKLFYFHRGSVGLVAVNKSWRY